MQVVCLLPSGKTIPLHVEPYYTIENLKFMIWSKEGIPVEQQWFIYAGKHLEDARILSDFSNESTESTLQVVLIENGPETRNQALKHRPFEEDKSILVDSFTMELHLAPRHGLL